MQANFMVKCAFFPAKHKLGEIFSWSTAGFVGRVTVEAKSGRSGKNRNLG
jgi:hypothetical protein